MTHRFQVRPSRQVARRAVPLLVLAAGMLTFGGCYKQRYEWSQSSTTSVITQARDYQASSFPESQTAFQAAEAAAKSAEGSYGSQQFSEALKQIGEAKRQANEALNQARSRFAAKQLESAQNSMKVATINDGQNENQRLFTEITQQLAEAQEKNNNQKYDDAIRDAKEVNNKVDALLARYKNTSENRLNELVGKLKDLERAEAEKYLPNPIIKAKDSIDQITALINDKRDYKQAVVLAGAAISDVEAAIIETKKRHSEAELRSLEEKMAMAVAEDALVHTPDAYKAAQESFEGILISYQERQYDSVLLAAGELRKRVDELVTMARIESTKERINSVRRGIAALTEQDVEQFLPGRIKVMEEFLVRADDLFNNADYDNAKFQAGNALIEQDRINAAFDALAEKAISQATGAVTAGRSTFERMTQIFGPSNSVADPRLEAQRQVQAARLEAALRRAVSELEFSNSNRGLKEFKKAIEQAKVAEVTSEGVADGTFRVVAEHTLVGIQDQVTELEQQGARVYASRSLTQVQELVVETKKLLAENQNRQAVELAARSRAYVENVRQELARVATEQANRAQGLVNRVSGGVAPRAGQTGRILLSGGEFPGGSLGRLDRDEVPGLERAPIVLAQVVAETGTNELSPLAFSPSLSVRPAPMASDGSTVMSGGSPVVPETQPSQPLGMNIEPHRLGDTTAMVSPRVGFVPADMAPVRAPSQPLGGSAEAEVAGGIDRIRDQVEGILADDRRVADIRRFNPGAVEGARQRLAESAALLQRGQYVQSIEAARNAQNSILAAERSAAASSARNSLRSAANRINLAQSSSAVTFAPAQVYESIRLFEQADSLLRKGDPLQAREAATRALVAAEDARLYNVQKARDLASLSTRYGGWEASTPALVNALANADEAERLLGNAATALEGQCLAQAAVQQAQYALDRARDFTFQERLDRIYEALHTSLRAGANYFNVTEVRTLIDEINTARTEYSTSNFDAVEIRLRDIEAGLARVIETTPLVLEQNLTVQTERLNALVLAGAQEYMAGEVDDVKSRMNSAALRFRDKDYYGSYSAVREAIQINDRIEERLQDQVYFDSVTELFAQLDGAFRDFSPVLDTNRNFLKKLVYTGTGNPRSIQLTTKLNPNDFRDRVTDIYLRGVNLKPPANQEAMHQRVLTVLESSRVASINFQKLYLMDQLSPRLANEIIDIAYNQIQNAKAIRADVQYRMIDPQARTKVITASRLYRNF